MRFCGRRAANGGGLSGYFANARYDGLFIPYRHFVPLPPKEEAKLHVILNAVKNPTEELTGIYFSLWWWDISLTLNMTNFFSTSF